MYTLSQFNSVSGAYQVLLCLINCELHLLAGKYSFLDLEDSSESEDMIGEYLADMQPCLGGSANNTITSIELAMSK